MKKIICLIRKFPIVEKSKLAFFFSLKELINKNKILKLGPFSVRIYKLCQKIKFEFSNTGPSLF